MRIGFRAGCILWTIATREVIDGAKISIVCGVERIVAGPRAAWEWLLARLLHRMVHLKSQTGLTMVAYTRGVLRPCHNSTSRAILRCCFRITSTSAGAE